MTPKAFFRILALCAQASVLGIMGAASMQAKDEDATQVDSKKIEQVHQTIEELNTRIAGGIFESYQKDVAEAKAREAASTPSQDTLNFEILFLGGASHLRGFAHRSNGKLEYVGVRKRNADEFNDTREGGGAKILTPMQAAYMAQRHSAEKIKSQVRKADALAKQLLEGGAPSHVLGR